MKTFGVNQNWMGRVSMTVQILFVIFSENLVSDALEPQIYNRGIYITGNINQQLTISQQNLKFGLSISFFFCNVVKKLVFL